MLDISQVSFSYGRRGPAVLDDFTLTFEEGGVYGLLGPTAPENPPCSPSSPAC